MPKFWPNSWSIVANTCTSRMPFLEWQFAANVRCQLCFGELSFSLEYYVLMKSKILQMKKKKTVNTQNLRPLWTIHLGNGRIICISVSRLSEAPKEGHGHSGGAADTESQSLPHVIVFYCVGPSLRGYCTCCLLCCLLSDLLQESPTNTPLLHTGDNEQIVPLHSMHKVSKDPSHFLFLLLFFWKQCFNLGGVSGPGFFTLLQS